MCKYSVIIKTGEAEIRAIEHSKTEVLNEILPLIEITRGRKVKEDYPFDKRLSKIKNLFQGKKVAIDLTSDEGLSSEAIDKLYTPKEGYENWVNFLIGIKKEKKFSEIIPTILINTEDTKYKENLLLQVQKLKKEFSTILYRNSIIDEGCYSDFEIIKDELTETDLFILIDCGYTVQASQNSYAEKVISRIKNIDRVLEKVNKKYIVTATSFPKNVSELGDVETDTFDLAAIKIHQTVSKAIQNQNVIYGDYGSINPTRNDNIVMARGWIPRIDVPLKYSIYYYKRRRPEGVTAYSSTYNEVAKKVVNDPRFDKEKIQENWGFEQIIKCSKGMSPGSQPNFWISVRMNIHLEQQVKRLFDK